MTNSQLSYLTSELSIKMLFCSVSPSPPTSSCSHWLTAERDRERWEETASFPTTLPIHMAKKSQEEGHCFLLLLLLFLCLSERGTLMPNYTL